MLLQGTMRPDQIISLLDIGRNTFAMGDHDDHIHVGFRPLFGDNKKLGQQALAVLKPGQWNDLIDRLRQIENPIVPTNPSKYALPVQARAAATPTAASSPVAATVFPFVQLEFGFVLGPPDGRYLPRGAPDAEPTR